MANPNRTKAKSNKGGGLLSMMMGGMMGGGMGGGGSSTPTPNDAYDSENIADADSANPMYVDSKGNDVTDSAQKNGTTSRYVQPSLMQRFFNKDLAAQTDALNTSYQDKSLSAQKNEQVTQQIVLPKIRAIMADTKGVDPSEISDKDVLNMYYKHGAEAQANSLSTGVMNQESQNQELNRQGYPRTSASLMAEKEQQALKEAQIYGSLGGPSTSAGNQILQQQLQGRQLGSQSALLPQNTLLSLMRNQNEIANQKYNIPQQQAYDYGVGQAQLGSLPQTQQAIGSEAGNRVSQAALSALNLGGATSRYPLNNAATNADLQRSILNSRTLGLGSENPSMGYLDENGQLTQRPNAYQNMPLINKIGMVNQIGQNAVGGMGTQGGTTTLPNGMVLPNSAKKATAPIVNLGIPSVPTQQPTPSSFDQSSPMYSNAGASTVTNSPIYQLSPTSTVQSPAVSSPQSLPVGNMVSGYGMPQSMNGSPVSLSPTQQNIQQGLQQADTTNEAVRANRLKYLLDKQKKFPIYMKYNGEDKELESLLHQQHLNDILDSSSSSK